MDTVENNGEAFNRDKFFMARKLAWEGLYQLAETIKPGDTEEAIAETYLQFFPKQTKSWHPPKIRFSKNTRCSFRDKSQELPPLNKGDLFFFDFGPVIEGHEADVGQTFCLGDNSFKNPAQIVFKKCEDLWDKEKLSGEDLYLAAHQFSEDLGFELNPRMAGHRLGDFPHALHHKGSLAHFQNCPQEILWVLEIHLLDRQKDQGYFYEDILGLEKS